MAVDKQQVLSTINIDAEVRSLLGNKQGQRFHCYRKEAHANGDKNASLSISPEGFYKCHSCGVKGDFFQLYMDVKGIAKERFGEVLLSFARNAGLDTTTTVTFAQKKSPKRTLIPKTSAKKKMFSPIRRCVGPTLSATGSG